MHHEEEWFTWKVMHRFDNEEKPRLLTPRGDPFEHEHPFDYLFETKEEAHRALDDFEAREEAIKDGWVLCRLRLETLDTP